MRKDARHVDETTLMREASREAAPVSDRLSAILDLTGRGTHGILEKPSQAIEILSVVSAQRGVPADVRQAAEMGMIAIRKGHFPQTTAPG